MLDALTTNTTQARSSLVKSLIKLARPHQWAKGAFVIIGPAYGVASGTPLTLPMVIGVAAAFMAFALASSSCYVINDLRDVEADRLHPRKRHRPIASGAVPPGTARVFSMALLAGGVAFALVPLVLQVVGATGTTGQSGWWLLLTIVLYLINTNLYSLTIKHQAVLDVMSLSLGFVLRVLGGCAAAGITPSSWLLNVTFFVSMFLAFGKRLGERRTMGSQEAAAATRKVQGAYTDELLRMAVVVTGVASLVTYAGYVQGPGARSLDGFNLLWFTMLPATYGLLRCIVLLERGQYDDPTELASKDRAFQGAVLVFGVITLAVVLLGHTPTM